MSKDSGGRSGRFKKPAPFQENLEQRLRREENALFRSRMQAAAIFGAALSPMLAFVDFLASESWFPTLPLLAFVVLRFGIALWFVAIWVFLRSAKRFPVAVLDWMIFAPPALGVGYMTAVTGGASSPYVAGTTLLVVARTLLVPGNARSHLGVVTFLVASYPLTILVFGPDHGDLLAWLSDRREVGFLAANLFPLVSIAGLGLVAADMIHDLHQKLVSHRALGRYKIRRELSRGAMGVVYLAWHRDLGRQCVVKLINPTKDSSGVTRRRFEREARETSQLASPYTVQVFDFGITQDGQLYYVMEYLDGEELETIVDREGAQPHELVSRWMCYACSSLAEAHERLLVHRDIKPANLFLSRLTDGDEIVKVLDFGIAKKVSAEVEGLDPDAIKKTRRLRVRLPESADMTSAGTIMGTPLYVAPEVLRGEEASSKADQYSLAATMYHLLTGRPAFLAPTVEELLYKTLEDEAPPPSAVCAKGGIPPELDAVVLRAMSKSPGDRFPTIAALRDALEPFAARHGARREGDGLVEEPAVE